MSLAEMFEDNLAIRFKIVFELEDAKKYYYLKDALRAADTIGGTVMEPSNGLVKTERPDFEDD